MGIISHILACSRFTQPAGPEWRETVYDEDKDVLEDPVDDGGRHRLWVAHTVKDRQWGYNTRIGGVFDLGRLVNYVADFVDYNVSGCMRVAWSSILGGGVHSSPQHIAGSGLPRQGYGKTGTTATI